MEYLESQAERDEILATLTDKQKEVLWQYYKEINIDLVITGTYQQADDWIFYDMEISPNYHSPYHGKEYKLYCECGAEVKYQYILYSNEADKYVKLSLGHLEKHYDIPDDIVTEINSNQFKMKSWLDSILVQVSRHHRSKDLEANYHQYLTALYSMTDKAFQQHNKNLITKPKIALISDFKAVDLPIPTALYEKVKEVVHRKMAVDRQQEMAKREQQRMIEGMRQRQTEQSEKQKTVALDNKQNKKKLHELSREQKENIADCRMIINRYLKKEKLITFAGIYELTKIYMDKLMTEFTKEEVIILLVTSINKHTGAYKVAINNDKQAIVKV